MRPPRPGFRLRAAWAAILSLVVPGLGHVYARAWRLGMLLVLANEALSVTIRLLASRTTPTIPNLGAGAVLVLLSLALMLATATDAARRFLKGSPGNVLPAAPARPRWFRSTWFVAIVLLAINLGIDLGIPFGWRLLNVPSASMVPSLMVGDNLVADTRAGQRIRRGDVILFAHVVTPSEANAAPPTESIYVKRVIGVPGDRIAIRDGRVVLNGTPLPWRDDGDFNIPQYMSFGIKAHRWTETLPTGDSYQVVTIPDPPPGNRTAPRTMPEITVPPGQTFVLGDNRDNSLDSRFPSFGTVPITRVIGRPTTIYWSRDRTRIMTPIL